MTRLKTSDICHIPPGLKEYNQQLLAGTGRTLLGIACHACGADEIKLKNRINSFTIHVVPITTGQGIISNFSETVTAILRFLGFNAMVSDTPDITGVAKSFESRADAIMMADDQGFVGINLNNRLVVDNSEATGRVFASALDLMAKGIKNCKVLVLGCGPVGEAAAHRLLSFGAGLGLYDIDLAAAHSLKEKLSIGQGIEPDIETNIKTDIKKGIDIVVETSIVRAVSAYDFILEATPSVDSIPHELITAHLHVAAPGVPLGISKRGCQMLKDRLIHDKLEMGVAAMAISLSFPGEETRGCFE